MEITLLALCALMIVSFAAGLIDSIAGGGGLLMLPSLLISGVPAQYALGTNKFTVNFGTGAAVINFARKKKIMLKIGVYGIVFALIGGFIGSRTILLFDQDIVGKLIIFLLPIAAIATLWPRKQAKNKGKIEWKDVRFKVPVICLIVGFYDGFFGPGTGSFLAIAFYAIIGLGLIEATANAKIINFATNLGALISFMIAGKVMYLLGLPLAAANIAGNFIGSRLAIKKGEKIIKPFLIIVLIILLITLVWKFVI
jgi:uncharacterized protein